MKLYNILYTSILMLTLFTFTACGDDEYENIVGTWQLTGYDAEVLTNDSEIKSEVENVIVAKYLFPSKGATYIFDENNNVTIYPNGLENQSYSGKYTYKDGKLNLSFAFGGGLSYSNLEVNISDNKMNVDEDISSTFSSGFPTLMQAIRIHNLVRK